jgi:glucosamine-6-phosphate deaminase
LATKAAGTCESAIVRSRYSIAKGKIISVSQLRIRIFDDKASLGHAAASHAADSLRLAIQQQGLARIVAATGASQFEFLHALTNMAGIGWSRVEVFHLDEYVGLPITHPASFRKYLLERFINRVGVQRFYPLDGEGDAAGAASQIGRELEKRAVDLAFLGIGENAHLAFNDPPADFNIQDPYLIVDLDQACRRQQVGEGWFATLEEVPKRAISMSVHQILRSKEIIVIVPDERKARAVKNSLEGEVTPIVPASILQTHSNATIYLDKHSAALLGSGVTAAG